MQCHWQLASDATARAIPNSLLLQTKHHLAVGVGLVCDTGVKPGAALSLDTAFLLRHAQPPAGSSALPLQCLVEPAALLLRKHSAGV